MRNILLPLAALALTTGPAMAHPDHDADEGQVRPISQVARDALVRLVSQAKLPATWSRAALVGSRETTVNGRRQTIVTFRNDAEKDPAKKLYDVAVTADGQFVSGNYRRP